MTVDELCARLLAMQRRGLGDLPITTALIDDEGVKHQAVLRFVAMVSDGDDVAVRLW